MARWIFPAICLALVSCRGPESYPPPAQFIMPSGPEPAPAMPDPNRPMIAMADIDWKSHVVDGVLDGPDGETFRWCRPAAQFRLTLNDVRGLAFYTRFILVDDVLRASGGGVILTVSINGHILDRAQITRGGDQDYERPVPPDWLIAGQPAIVTLELSQSLAMPNGERLGVLLHSIGFKR